MGFNRQLTQYLSAEVILAEMMITRPKRIPIAVALNVVFDTASNGHRPISLTAAGFRVTTMHMQSAH
jgi:hypothetical protein